MTCTIRPIDERYAAEDGKKERNILINKTKQLV